jgi:RNA polymerase sigma-70 factor (ECF subfamily)
LRRPGGGDRSDGSLSSEQRAEAELVARLQAYDEAAIRQVYRLYADSIYRYAFYQSGDPELAEDVAGEVFVRMMESIGTYAYRGRPISAWLYRTARNLIIDHQRRRNRLKPLDEAIESSLISDNPIDLAELQLTANEMYATLNGLTDEQRQVIVLKFLENLDNRRIAEIIGKSEGSVKSLQHRALRSLRRLLEKRGTYAGRS